MDHFDDSAQGVEPGGTSRSVRIVLADSRTMLREGVRRALSDEPLLTVVAEARDLDEAVQVTRDLRPDILVVGLDATPGEARTTLERLAAVHPPERSVLLTTGDDMSAQVLGEERTGALLPETASMRDLITAIRLVHGGGRYVYHPPATLYAPAEAPWERDIPTRRELEVLRLVEQGKSNREISELLSIVERTVEFHLGNVFAKLGARSRTEALHLARRRGLLE